MKKPTPDPKLEVRLLSSSRARKLADALQTDILPIQHTRGAPRIELIDKDDGKVRSYVADQHRLTGTQLTRISKMLVAKYREIGYGTIDLAEMHNTIKKFGFTIPLDDCELIRSPLVKQASFLERSAPQD